MIPVLIVSRTVTAADVWSESDAAITGMRVEVLRDPSALQERTSEPALVIAGEEADTLRETLMRLAREPRLIGSAALLDAGLRSMSTRGIDTSREYVIRIDAEGDVVAAGQLFLDAVGRPESEVVGSRLSAYLAPESQESIAMMLVGLRDGRQPNGSMMLVIQRDGEPVAALGVAPRVIRDGNAMNVQLVGHEVTEQLRRDGELAMANKKLALLGSMARHDILNKAMIVSGYIEMASSEPMGADAKMALDSARRVLDNIVKMMESTRNYQKLGTTDLVWISIAREISPLRGRLAASGVDLVCTTADLEVLVDPIFIIGLENIVENSALHGQRASQVTVSACERGKDVLLRISDNGVGVPETDKERIFSWTYKNRSAHSLHLARESLAITGIEIREVGIPGKGAIFEMTIPPGRFRRRPRGKASSNDAKD